MPSTRSVRPISECISFETQHEESLVSKFERCPDRAAGTFIPYHVL
jgi:hypothetical protein